MPLGQGGPQCLPLVPSGAETMIEVWEVLWATSGKTPSFRGCAGVSQVMTGERYPKGTAQTRIGTLKELYRFSDL